MKTSQSIKGKADSRIKFAVRRGHELGNEIRSWGEQFPITLESELASNKQSWKATLRFSKEPDLDDWTHIFGDAIHNLRSTLNNMVTEIASAEGVTGKDLKAVQFPITDGIEKWPSQQRWIKHLPTEVKAAIEQLQPYHRPGFDGRPAHTDPLAVLAELSNQDKHRLELVPSVELQEIAHNYGIEFELEIPKKELQSVMDRMVLDGRFEPDVVVISHDTSPYRINQVLGHSQWKGSVIVTTDDGTHYSPAHVLETLVPYTENVVTHVLTAWEGAKT